MPPALMLWQPLRLTNLRFSEVTRTSARRTTASVTDSNGLRKPAQIELMRGLEGIARQRRKTVAGGGKKDFERKNTRMANSSEDHSGAYYCTEPEVWNSESDVRVCIYISLYIINAGNCDGLQETNHRGELHFCCELSQHCISAVRARTPEFPTWPRGFI